MAMIRTSLAFDKDNCFNQEDNRRTLIRSSVYTVLVFVVFLSFWNQPVFSSDEPEIFVKGQQIARGELLYQMVDSQHMPLMYHFAALLAKAGVSGIAGFRTGFYALYAVFFGCIFYRGSDLLGTKALAAFLVSYVSLISTISYGTAVLCEHFQGLGMTMLFLELILYMKNRRFGVKSYIFCGIAAFISFGGAFVSIFGLFAFFTGIIALNTKWSGAEKFDLCRCTFDVLKIAVSMFVPLSMYFMYFVATGTVKELFQWAYRFNVEVYSKYLDKGYGGSVLGALFGGISNIAGTFKFDTISSAVLMHVVVIAVCLLFVVEKWEENRIYAVVLVFFTITCATRAVFDFHGIPVLALFSFIIGYEFDLHYNRLKSLICRNRLRRVCAIVLMALMCSGFLTQAKAVFYYSTDEVYNTASTGYALRVLGDDYEEIGFFHTNHELLMQGRMSRGILRLPPTVKIQRIIFSISIMIPARACCLLRHALFCFINHVCWTGVGCGGARSAGPHSLFLRLD